MNLLRTSSQKRLFRSVIVYFLTFCMFFNASLPVVLAGPDGAQVVNGNVSIQQSGYNTTITASDKAIINYSSFDISRPEIVQFIQPDTSASVLNRILSANPTNINGTLLANGRVFFVNPAGVYFGNGAKVNVNQLVASALNITDADFINGRYNFVGGEGSVINEGDIFAEKVYLIGRQVANSGSISCPSGYVVMASGDRVFLGEPGSDIVLEIEGPSLPESADPIEGSGVLNEGTVEAAGGKIVLAAAGDIYSQAISNVGSLSVSNDMGNAGEIKLTAVDGDVINTGTIEASGSEGGQIAMEGTRVGQFGTIHADGTDSHGGSVDLTASEVVALSSDSLTTANAGLNGDGGDVTVFSPDTALFWPDALIEVKGGTLSGNGGFAEVSGREHVEIFGLVNATAVNGESGSLLIDPYDVTISTNADAFPPAWPGTPFTPTGSGSNINTGTLNTQLGLSSITITTVNGGGFEHGDITVSNQIDLDGGKDNTLTLQAEDDIIINAQILDTDLGTPDAVNITLTALDGNPGDGPSVDIGQSIDTYGGNFTSSGTTFDNTGGIISTNGGDIAINHSGLVTLGAQLNPGSGTMSGTSTSIGVASNAASIQDAIDIAMADATPADNLIITVKDGTYDEDLLINKSNLTLLSENGASATTIQTVDGIPGTNHTGISVPSSGAGFTLGGDLNVDPDKDNGFTILSGATVNRLIELENAPSGVTISNNIIDLTDNAVHGISVGVAGATGLTVNENDFISTETGEFAIWGPLMVNVTVTDNAFTASNKTGTNAMQFAGVAGGTISGNDISGFGRGIGIYDGLSSLTITDNTISNGTTGIDIMHYGAGIKTGLVITDNTLTANATGLKIGDHTTVKADTFTITGNSFLGNTTAGLVNLNSTYSVTAVGNYWDSANGPTIASNTFNVGYQGDAITEAAAGSVTYVQWLDSVGGSLFAPVENTTVGGVFYASIQAGIDDASSDNDLRAEAGTFTENVHADDQIDVDFKVGDSVIDGSLTTEAGCEITSSGSLRITGSVEAASDITASTGLTFESSVTADGAGSQTFDAGAGALTVATITKASGDLTLGGATGIDIAGDLSAVGLTLEDDVTASDAGSQEFDAEGGTLTAKSITKAAGDLTLGGATGIDIAGDLSAVGLTLEDDVTASDAGSQEFDAEGGTLTAKSITKAAGDLTLGGATGIDIAGNLSAVGLTLEDDVTASGAGSQEFDAEGGTLTAKSITKAAGDLTLGGATGIDIAGDLSAVGLTLEDDVTASDAGSQEFDAEGGTLTAKSITKAAGDLTLGGATGIDIAGDLSAVGLTLEDDVTASDAGSQEFDAEGGTLTAKSITKAAGDLTLGGATGIDIAGNLSAVGLTLEDDVTASGAGSQEFDAEGGTLTAKSITKAAGDLTLGGATGIDIAGDLSAVGLTLEDDVTASDAGSQEFDAEGGTLTAKSITKASGDLTLGGATGIDIAGDLSAVGLTLEDDVTASDAGSQEFDAEGGTLTAKSITKAAGDLTLGGATGIDIAGDLSAVGLTLEDDVTASDAGSQEFDAEGGTLTAKSITKAAGDLTLGGATGIDIAGNLSAVGLTLEDDVTASGAGSQEFDAEGGTLTAKSITKAAGDLTLGGATGIDIAGDLSAVGLTLEDDVTASDAGSQEFDAEGGTLTAKSITKAAGDLTLGGATGIDIAGDLSAVGLTLEDDVTASDAGSQEFDAEGGTLTAKSITKAAGDLTLGGATGIDIAGNLSAVGLTLEDDVTASDAGSQEFDAEGGTLTAKSITKAAGDLTLGGATGIDLDGTVDVQGGNLALEDNATVADDEMLKASGNVTVAAGKTLTAEGHLKVEATGGSITAGLITMQADDKTLTLTQNDAIDMAAFSVTNDEDTDLVANSTDGSVTSSTADSWQSITAEAKDNIELTGTGDIKIAATGLLSHEGGVKVVSYGGSIYTPGAGDTLNAPITGYSDESADIGVDLIYPYWPELGTKAAIVIWSPYKDLKIGPDAVLTANGTYDPTQFDDRLSFLVDFFTPTDLRGDPVDVAIYLGSNYSGNVDMGSGFVWIDNKSLTEIGTLAIDAYDTVTFTEAFENSLPGSTVRRLEVISRSSEDVSMAIANEALPYVDNPSLLADGLYLGTYVLRGRDLLFTQVLKKREEAPIVPPKLEEPEEQGAVEEPDMEALIALLEELGIGVHPYLARAFRDEKSGINTLNTDLRLFKAAEKLQKLIPMLEDTEGRRIAALRVVVGQSFSTLASISDEQMASFRQELALHVGDGTDYDLAGQTISSLTGYVEILSTDIGWPTDRSMAFVMGRYIPRLTEGDAIRTAVVQIRMQEALGI